MRHEILARSHEVFVSHRSYLLSVIISVLLFSGLALSQQPAADAGKKDEVAETQQKALKLLESLAGDVSNLRSPENRARIGSNIADLLWSHDEKRARGLFAAAGDDLKAAFTNIEPDEPHHAETLMVFAFLRSNVITRIGKHDPELALEFLQSTRPGLYTKVPNHMKEMDRAVELQLAGQVAAKNPELALKIGRQSLLRGVSADLLPTLTQIHAKNKDLARGFYTEIVNKLKETNLLQENTALDVALNLVRSFPPPAADEQPYRELINILLGNALANGCAGTESETTSDYFCVQIATIFPQMEKYYAARAAGLKRWAQDEQNVAYSEFYRISDSLEQGTLDEVMAQAQKYPELHDRIYWIAMKKAIALGDFEKARQIVADTQNEEQRGYMLQALEGEQSWQSISAEKLAEVQHFTNGIPRSDERVQYLLAIASKISGNRKAALGLVDQAAQLVDSIKPGREQLFGQMQVAMTYCFLKNDRGFAIMESLIPKFNELVSAGAVLDRVDNDYLRDGEWSMTGKGNLGGILTNLAQNAGYFAWSDFDRAVRLASQFERPELRLMALSKLAQSIIEGPANKGPAVRGMFGDVRQ